MLQATHAKRACWEGVLVGFSCMRGALGVGFGLAGSARGRQCGEHLGFSASDGRIGRDGRVLHAETKSSGKYEVPYTLVLRCDCVPSRVSLLTA